MNKGVSLINSQNREKTLEEISTGWVHCDFQLNGLKQQGLDLCFDSVGDLGEESRVPEDFIS